MNNVELTESASDMTQRAEDRRMGKTPVKTERASIPENVEELVESTPVVEQTVDTQEETAAVEIPKDTDVQEDVAPDYEALYKASQDGNYEKRFKDTQRALSQEQNANAELRKSNEAAVIEREKQQLENFDEEEFNESFLDNPAEAVRKLMSMQTGNKTPISNEQIQQQISQEARNLSLNSQEQAVREEYGIEKYNNLYSLMEGPIRNNPELHDTIFNSSNPAKELITQGEKMVGNVAGNSTIQDLQAEIKSLKEGTNLPKHPTSGTRSAGSVEGVGIGESEGVRDIESFAEEQRRNRRSRY